MAYQQIVIVLVMLMVACLPLNGAVDLLVGGERGWAVDVNYTAWAEGLQFHVGDNLVFKYQRGDHSVVRVDGDGFRDCTPAAGAEVFATGKDVITLSTPGKKWYICGISVHCSVGNQKLEITVLSQAQAPESSTTFGEQPPASSSENRRGVAGFYAVMVALTVIAIIVMF